MPPRPVVALFLCLFANQSGTLVLSPILVEVARDFEVSTAAAGQLRAVSGVAAGATALAIGMLARSAGLRRLILSGLALLAAGCLASAAAPAFFVLALAQVPSASRWASSSPAASREQPSGRRATRGHRRSPGPSRDRLRRGSSACP